MTPEIHSAAPERVRRCIVPSIPRTVPVADAFQDDSTPGDEKRENMPARFVCDVCGQPARVHILEGYQQGQPVHRRFCLRCAPEAPPWNSERGFQHGKLRLSILIGATGIGLGALALLADHFIPMRTSAGFGWHKGGGLVIGALLLLIGTLSRADLIAIGGLLLFGASCFAGLFGWAQSPGIGWKQQLLLELSAVCVILCILGRFGAAAYLRRSLRLRKSALSRRSSCIQE